jgi:hypothetical protein
MCAGTESSTKAGVFAFTKSVIGGHMAKGDQMTNFESNPLPNLFSTIPSQDSDGDALKLFGQFVGSWQIRAKYYNPYGSESEAQGEVHFAWVLEGKAIQDVWCTQKGGRPVAVGTTLRYFDPEINAIRCVWLAPGQPVLQQFIARQVEDEIVLQSQDQEKSEKWTYFRITPQSFGWRAEERMPEDENWMLTEEMWVTRLPK